MFATLPSHAGRFRPALTGTATFVALLSAALVLGPGAPAASAQDDAGSIIGAVVDELGGVLPGATVTLEHEQTGLVRSAVTDAQGIYSISRLPAGDYGVTVLMPGFLGESTTVTVGSTAARLDLTLGIAPIAETVEVTRSAQTLATVPNAVAVVGNEQINFTERRSSLDEVLRGIPGLFVQNRRNYGLSGGVGLSIRAPQPRFGLRGLAIIQDGIPITTADGTTEPGNVDLGSVRRIEVIRGPSSVLYGNSAGGVISLFTEIDPSRRFAIRPDLQWGSNGYQRQQVRADGHNNSGTSFMGSFTRFQTDGWRDHSEADIRQTNVVVRQAVGARWHLTGVFNHYDSPFAESASFLTAAQAGDPRLPAAETANANPRQARPCMGRFGCSGHRSATVAEQNWGEIARQGQGGATLEYRFAGTQVFRATGWASNRKLDAGGVGQVIDLSRQGRGLRSEYLGASESGAVTWTTGVDVATQDDDRMEFGFMPPFAPGSTSHRAELRLDQQEQVLSAGPFAQVGLSPHARVTLTAGVRYDYYRFRAIDRLLADGDQSGERTMGAASPSVGLTVAATENLNLYGNVSTAYETPTTVELSNTPTGEGGFNQALDPERLRSVEFGIRGLVEPARLHYDIAVYRARVLDAFVPFNRPDDRTFFANAGETDRTGLEFSINWQPVSVFSARAAYTRQHFVFDEFLLGGHDFSGNLEPGTPPHRFFAGIDYAIPGGLRGSMTVRHVAEFTLTNDESQSNWAHTVVDLRFGLDQQAGDVEIRPFVGIDNLFGVRYNSSAITNAFGRRYYEPSPGREIYVGITFGGGVR
ncbi:MAG: TonB-dependent receptor [Acidobacteria bacterium]|nr:TonB-dependent receptor [Acidobacteriota bacterium]MYJ03637.1 TonB-dependent receptor [Acidobacteriota bacterium]